MRNAIKVGTVKNFGGIVKKWRDRVQYEWVKKRRRHVGPWLVHERAYTTRKKTDAFKWLISKGDIHTIESLWKEASKPMQRVEIQTRRSSLPTKASNFELPSCLLQCWCPGVGAVADLGRWVTPRDCGTSDVANERRAHCSSSARKLR